MDNGNHNNIKSPTLPRPESQSSEMMQSGRGPMVPRPSLVRESASNLIIMDSDDEEDSLQMSPTKERPQLGEKGEASKSAKSRGKQALRTLAETDDEDPASFYYNDAGKTTDAAKNREKEGITPREPTTTTPAMRRQAVDEILQGELTDYERILGVYKLASEKDINRAFRQKVKLVHPDHHQESAESRQKANKALECVNYAYRQLSSNPTLLDDLQTGESFHVNAFEGDDSGDEANDYEGGYEDKPKDQNKQSKEELNIKHTLDAINKMLSERKGRTAPPSIVRAYESVTKDIEAIIANPDDEAAVMRAENVQTRIKFQNGSEKFDLNISLIRQLARNKILRREALRQSPDNMVEMTQYASAFLTFECEKQCHGWLQHWYLDQPSEAIPIAFAALANPYIEILKRNPKNRAAKKSLDSLSSMAKEWFEENNLPDTWNVEDLPQYYRDLAAGRSGDRYSDQRHSELETYLVQHNCPRSWALRSGQDEDRTSDVRNPAPVSRGNNRLPRPENKVHGPTFSERARDPDSMDIDKPAPKTRDGEAICGHRSWQMSKQHEGKAFLFAVLPDKDIPIGELRSGTKIGKDAMKGYLASDAVQEVCQVTENDQHRFLELEAVFAHTSQGNTRAPEIWVNMRLGDRSETGEELNVEKKIATRSSYRIVRSGVDADYDIVQFFEKYGRKPPAQLVNKLPSRKNMKVNEPSLKVHLISDKPASGGDPEADLEKMMAELRQQKRPTSEQRATPSGPTNESTDDISINYIAKYKHQRATCHLIELYQAYMADPMKSQEAEAAIVQLERINSRIQDLNNEAGLLSTLGVVDYGVFLYGWDLRQDRAMLKDQLENFCTRKQYMKGWCNIPPTHDYGYFAEPEESVNDEWEILVPWLRLIWAMLKRQSESDSPSEFLDHLEGMFLGYLGGPGEDLSIAKLNPWKWTDYDTMRL
ncbi:J domain-containing protein [Aspergillus affinis]|uniref:J domain-containing protein n=1 Tax=Aspergillus affinis TaxID=1070780 RepID=UPI0022FE9087|nr:chaperone protein DnaJ [Aspergillus affinis]KAI9039856.1 chaperone protein DnaJ [Aspergillus affinis]